MKKSFCFKKTTSVVIGIAFVLIFIFYFFTHKFSVWGNPIVAVSIGKQKIRVEEVRTQERMQKGLAGRRNLCEDCGMLFLFSESGKKAFWMKGMLIPLDIIWLEGEKVVHVREFVAPDDMRVLAPDVSADKVLEIPAGRSAQLGIVEGMKVEIER